MLKLFGQKKKKRPPVLERPLHSKSSSSITTSNSSQATRAIKMDLKLIPSSDDNTVPVLMMPKPRYAVPPTRSVLESHDNDKTQVEQDPLSVVLPAPQQQQQQGPQGGLYRQKDDRDNAPPSPAAIADHETSNNRKDLAIQELSPLLTSSEGSNRVYETAVESPLSSSISLHYTDPSIEDMIPVIIPAASRSEPTFSTGGRRRQSKVVAAQLPPTTVVNEDLSMPPNLAHERYYYPMPTELTGTDTGTGTGTVTATSEMSALPTKEDEIDDLLATTVQAQMVFPPPPPHMGPTRAPDMEALQWQVEMIKQQCERERVEYEKREHEHRIRERGMLQKISETQKKLNHALMVQQQRRAAAAAAETTTPRPRSANDSGYWGNNDSSDINNEESDGSDGFKREYMEYGSRGRRQQRGSSLPRMTTRQQPPQQRQRQRRTSRSSSRSSRHVENADVHFDMDDDEEVVDDDRYYHPLDYYVLPQPGDSISAYPRYRAHAYPRPPRHWRNSHHPPQPHHRAPPMYPPDYHYYYPHLRYRVARPWE